MERQYDDEVIAEVNRLSRLGWQDWTLDEQKVKVSRTTKQSAISFPSDWYSPESTNAEASGIWAEARANKINNLLNEYKKSVIWEVGAGNGNVAIPLRKNGKIVIGVEPLRRGIEALAKDGIIGYWGTLEDLAFPNSSIDAIGLFDVLEHLEDPGVVLSEIRRVLRPGGLLIVTVPANQWLFSDFDLSIGHFRRYSRNSLNQLLVQNGFHGNKIEYFFLVLVFPAFVLRTIPYKLGRRRKYESQNGSNSTLTKVMKILEPLLRIVFKIEERFSLPLGLSLISSSVKSEVADSLTK